MYICIYRERGRDREEVRVVEEGDGVRENEKE